MVEVEERERKNRLKNFRDFLFLLSLLLPSLSFLARFSPLLCAWNESSRRALRVNVHRTESKERSNEESRFTKSIGAPSSGRSTIEWIAPLLFFSLISHHHLTLRVMLSVGASCLTLLQQPTKTASDAVATMLALAGMGRNAGASDMSSRSRCDLGAGSASSWPWTCCEEEEAAAAAAAAAGLADVVAMIEGVGGSASERKKSFPSRARERRKGERK